MVSDGSSDDDDGNVQLQYKVVVLGDGAVGKTSICHRFTDDNFEKSYKQTVGLDFFIKQVVLGTLSRLAVFLCTVAEPLLRQTL